MAGATPGSARFADAGDQRHRADDDQSKRYRRTECERLHSGAGRDGVSTLADAAGRNLYRYRRLEQCGDRIYRCTVKQQRAQPNAGRHAVFGRNHSRLVSQFRQRAGGNRLLRCRPPSGARRAARRKSKHDRRATRPVNFNLSQTGGALSLGVNQASATAPNLFYVTVPAVANAAARISPRHRELSKRTQSLPAEWRDL